MGNLFSAQVNQVTQKTTNEVYQKSEQSCSASCSNVQSGNTVFLDGSTTGDITFKQVCTASASCTMSNAVEQVLESLQEAKQKNQTEANLFGGGLNFGSVNLNLTDQEIRNQVEQILNTVCKADVNNIQNDNMVYARNSSTGNITFEQNGNAKADCIMQNSAIAKANLKQKADQSNAIVAGGLGGIMGFIMLIIILAIVFTVIKSKGNQGGGGGGNQGGGGYQGQKMNGY